MKFLQYMNEPWFTVLDQAAKTHKREGAAHLLGVSAPVVSQVLNGSGKYGEGKASTDKLAERVMHTFGRYACPYLTEQSHDGADVVITAEQCRGYAHRQVPTGSPREMQHWQRCNSCTHKALSAPPEPREVKPRARKEEASS